MYTQKKFLILLGTILVIASCAPKVSSVITKNYGPLDYTEDVLVFGLETFVPDGAEDMGTIKVGDSGFTTDCDWNIVLEKAKTEARKVGGNAIKITEHRTPDFMSSCHRITATVLRISNASEIAASIKKDDDLVADWDYALLHIYRFGGQGALVSYDVYLGNEVICRARNRWKETIQIRSFGLNTVWASTESKTEIPVNFEQGREYYIRCGISMGIAVGRPTLQLVDNNTGKSEFASISTR